MRMIFHQYIFTLGLATSAVVDLLITATLCYYLRRKRPEFARYDVQQRRNHLSLTELCRVNHMIDALTLYTVENGMLTWYAIEFL